MKVRKRGFALAALFFLVFSVSGESTIMVADFEYSGVSRDEMIEYVDDLITAMQKNGVSVLSRSDRDVRHIVQPFGSQP
jgi:hypothetical protein